MRSDSDKLAMSPILVTFGETEYKIKPLRTLAQREWRAKLAESLGTVLSDFNITTSDSKILSGGLVAGLMQFPEKITELLFAYGPDLPQQTVLEESTEEQIVLAFSEVMAVAFPFLGQLGMITGMLRSEALGSQRPASSKLQ